MRTALQIQETLFSSFNARNMSYREIAGSFVPPKQFEELAQPSHSVLIGPRGSGKTTLLKMLEIPSLRVWKAKQAQKYQDSISFISVFIPADLLWGKFLTAVASAQPAGKSSQQLSRIAFRNHCILSLLKAIQGAMQAESEEGPIIARLRIAMSENEEQAFARAVADLLNFSDAVPSIHGIRTAIRRQLLIIEDFCIRLIEGEDINGEMERFTREVGAVAPLQTLSAILDELEPHYDSGTRWALLFDELEIAPPHIRKLLIGALRSTDQRLLFKLAFSPGDQTLFGLKEESGASADQDYTEIVLWYENKEQARGFCRALTMETMRSVLQVRGQLQNQNNEVIVPKRLESVFGLSDFDVEDKQGARGYQSGSHTLSAFRDLAGKDQSFAEYLSYRGVDLDNLDNMTVRERASKLRKIKPIVIVRNYFVRRYDQGFARSDPRSRKTLQLYTGLYSLWAISEGNPRWLKGLLHPLLYRLAILGERPVPKLQANRVATMAARFRASLRTIPVESGDTRFQNLEQLLDRIGSYFHDGLVSASFRPEPPGSFNVDEAVSPGIVDAISRAQEVGAIVWLKEDGDPATTFEARPVGRRYRLCHLLGAINGLTLTTLSPVSLSSILSKDVASATQLSIFDVLEDEN